MRGNGIASYICEWHACECNQCGSSAGAKWHLVSRRPLSIAILGDIIHRLKAPVISILFLEFRWLMGSKWTPQRQVKKMIWL